MRLESKRNFQNQDKYWDWEEKKNQKLDKIG